MESVGMSSPSGTADHGAAGPARVSGLGDVDRLVDTGEPIDDLPPLIEPVAWNVRGPRPPRRKFLAAASAGAPASDSPAGEIPAVIEPVAVQEVPAPSDSTAPLLLLPVPAVEAPAAPPQSPRTAAGRVPVIAARLAGWSARGRNLVAAAPRWQLAAAAAVAVTLVVLAVLMVAVGLGLGLFAHTRHYSTAGAPSDPAARLAYFQEGAEAGDPDAELQLGILYAKGEGVKQDYETAGKWFRAAADRGVARAQYDLGVLYERGRGVPLDLTEAANWYLKGAQGGHPLAQYNLAVCYIKGQGIRQDTAEGALWYRRAATQGVVQAMANLAIMYEKGEGVAASPVDAHAWFLAAGRRANQAAARHAEDVFAAMTKTDQIRAQALASDVAASIHVPEGGDKPGATAAGGGP
jgi:hypothetical protein